MRGVGLSGVLRLSGEDAGTFGGLMADLVLERNLAEYRYFDNAAEMMVRCDMLRKL
jgi:hypothetical protein